MKKKFAGTNVVVTNASSRNHGLPATLTVESRANSISLVNGINGGNEYGISLDRSKALPLLVAELIRVCPRSAAPALLTAMTELLLLDD